MAEIKFTSLFSDSRVVELMKTILVEWLKMFYQVYKTQKHNYVPHFVIYGIGQTMGTKKMLTF